MIRFTSRVLIMHVFNENRLKIFLRMFFLILYLEFSGLFYCSVIKFRFDFFFLLFNKKVSVMELLCSYIFVLTFYRVSV